VILQQTFRKRKAAWLCAQAVALAHLPGPKIKGGAAMSLSRQVLIEGRSSQEAIVGRNVSPTLTLNGVLLRHNETGDAAFIETTTTPKPGEKVMARKGFLELAKGPFIGEVVNGGGLFNIGARMRFGANGHSNGHAVRLLNSGSPMTTLDQECRQLGIGCDSLGRHNGVTNVVIPLENDRLTIQEPCTVCSESLSAQQWGIVTSVVANATVVISSSSNDAALTMAVLVAANGCCRYAQLTGGIGLEATLLLGKIANEVAANFGELCNLGRKIGLTIPEVDETDEGAPAIALDILQAMQTCGWAGKEAAVCTLGKCGCVVADWVKGQIYRIPLEMIDGSPGVATPVGTGDRWFAEYIILRETWSKQGYLRDPIAATALRATHRVARHLGLSSRNYDAYIKPI
jgi:hypothetical protein